MAKRPAAQCPPKSTLSWLLDQAFKSSNSQVGPFPSGKQWRYSMLHRAWNSGEAGWPLGAGQHWAVDCRLPGRREVGPEGAANILKWKRLVRKRGLQSSRIVSGVAAHTAWPLLFCNLPSRAAARWVCSGSAQQGRAWAATGKAECVPGVAQLGSAYGGIIYIWARAPQRLRDLVNGNSTHKGRTSSQTSCQMGFGQRFQGTSSPLEHVTQ